MELKVFKDTLAAYGGRWETRQELPVETEILIPDYQPAVFKIVKCLMQPVVLQNRVASGRWHCEGYLRCTVYYQSDEPAAACTAPSRNLPLKNRSSSRTLPLPKARPRSGANRNTATAAPSVSTASTCVGRTSCVPRR